MYIVQPTLSGFVACLINHFINQCMSSSCILYILPSLHLLPVLTMRLPLADTEEGHVMFPSLGQGDIKQTEQNTVELLLNQSARDATLGHGNISMIYQYIYSIEKCNFQLTCNKIFQMAGKLYFLYYAFLKKPVMLYTQWMCLLRTAPYSSHVASVSQVY